MSWTVRRRSWRTSSWILATVSRVVQLLGLPVCSPSSTDVRPALNWACHWNTCVRLKLSSPKACCVTVRVSVAFSPRLAKIWCTLAVPLINRENHHRSYSKEMRVKTVHVHPAMCNLAHWLTRHGSPTIHRCFELPQLLYRWRHQSWKFCIPSCKWHVFGKH
jgi:hypothetical protein